MTFAELISELVARGAEDNDTRNGRRINKAYRRILNAYDWPFTLTTATGSSGAGAVTITDLRKVILVGDVSDGTVPGRRLKKISYEELVEDVGVEDISVTGTPEFWWYDAVGTAINTYPVGGTVYARYYKRVDQMTDPDSPIFDEEYHDLIVDRAMIEVYKDNDEFQKAREEQAEFLTSLGAMASDYQIYSREHGYIQVLDPRDG